MSAEPCALTRCTRSASYVVTFRTGHAHPFCTPHLRAARGAVPGDGCGRCFMFHPGYLELPLEKRKKGCGLCEAKFSSIDPIEGEDW